MLIQTTKMGKRKTAEDQKTKILKDQQTKIAKIAIIDILKPVTDKNAKIEALKLVLAKIRATQQQDEATITTSELTQSESAP